MRSSIRVKPGTVLNFPPESTRSVRAGAFLVFSESPCTSDSRATNNLKLKTKNFITILIAEKICYISGKGAARSCTVDIPRDRHRDLSRVAVERTARRYLLISITVDIREDERALKHTVDVGVGIGREPRRAVPFEVEGRAGRVSCNIGAPSTVPHEASRFDALIGKIGCFEPGATRRATLGRNEERADGAR